MMNGQGGKNSLDATASTKKMTGHRFGSTDSDPVGMVFKNRLDRHCFIHIVHLCRGAMCIDMIDFSF